MKNHRYQPPGTQNRVDMASGGASGEHPKQLCDGFSLGRITWNWALPHICVTLSRLLNFSVHDFFFCNLVIITVSTSCNCFEDEGDNACKVLITVPDT